MYAGLFSSVPYYLRGIAGVAGFLPHFVMLSVPVGLLIASLSKRFTSHAITASVPFIQIWTII